MNEREREQFERQWPNVKGDVVVLMCAVALLLRTHPARDDIIGSVEQFVNDTRELLLKSMTPDAQIDALPASLAQLLDMVRQGRTAQPDKPA